MCTKHIDEKGFQHFVSSLKKGWLIGQTEKHILKCFKALKG
jgi:hypothetical protein